MIKKSENKDSIKKKKPKEKKNLNVYHSINPNQMLYARIVC